jgi:hypothetical protein
MISLTLIIPSFNTDRPNWEQSGSNLVSSQQIYPICQDAIVSPLQATLQAASSPTSGGGGGDRSGAHEGVIGRAGAGGGHSGNVREDTGVTGAVAAGRGANGAPRTAGGSSLSLSGGGGGNSSLCNRRRVSFNPLVVQDTDQVGGGGNPSTQTQAHTVSATGVQPSPGRC